MWGRPLRQRDRDEVGENAPGGPILATLEEPLTEAWLARAPKSLSRAYLDTPA